MRTLRTRRNQLRCQELVALVTDYLDGVLSRRQRHGFEMHLRTCLRCPKYVEQIRAVARAASRSDPSAGPLPGQAELAELFRPSRRLTSTVVPKLKIQ